MIYIINLVWLTSRDRTVHNVYYVLLHLALHEQIFPPVNILQHLFLKVGACEFISCWGCVTFQQNWKGSIKEYLKFRNYFVRSIDSPESRVYLGWALRQVGLCWFSLTLCQKWERRYPAVCCWVDPWDESKMVPRERASERWVSRAPHIPVLAFEVLWLFSLLTDTYLQFLS